MGYLTPILFRNDHINELCNDPEQLAKIVKQSAVSMNNGPRSFDTYRKNPNRRWWQFWKPRKVISGILVNPIEALKPDHADFDRLILVRGNTWVDLNDMIYSESWKYSTEQIEKDVAITSKYLREMKRVLKNRKESESD